MSKTSIYLLAAIFVGIALNASARPNANHRPAAALRKPAKLARTQARQATRAHAPRKATTNLRIAKGAKNNTIDIRPRASDPNVSVELLSKNRMRIRGTANGPTDAKDGLGLRLKGVYAKSVQVSLDIDTAPTTNLLRPKDIFSPPRFFGFPLFTGGRRAIREKDFREKNSRNFVVYTSPGASAAQIADALAKKVNAHKSFRADVSHNKDGSATLRFERK